MNIVFVHFESKLPRFLMENIKRTIQVFPNNQVFLITDLESHSLEIPGLTIFSYQRSKDWKLLEHLLSHPKSFRHNFSLTSTARFLALAEFSSIVPGEIVHVESDVILSEDFPFSALSQKGSKIAFPVVNEELAIASILYLRDTNASKMLSDYTLKAAKANSLTTDMHILREISKKEGKNFQLLPTTPSNQWVLPNVPRNFFNENEEAFEIFRSYFDGGDLGRYLFGDDPRNWGGRPPVRHNPSITFYDIRNIAICTDPARIFPYIASREKAEKFPIHALHIHSKEVRLFKLKKQAFQIKKAVRNSQKPTTHRFFAIHFCRSALRRLNPFVLLR